VIARGNNHREIILDLVPYDVDVKNGDLVVTSGKGESFLSGLVIGKIISSQKSQTQVFQEVRAETMVDPSSFVVVTVIKKSDAKSK
jgi:cell shape-determining protein MreC